MDETALEILFDGKHGLSLKQGLNMLYKDKTLCDVTLTSSDGVDIQAHWLVLAAHSDFLRHLAVSRMQSMASDTGSLKLNIESEILNMMLDYLYTGELVVTKNTLHKIKLAAKLLQLSKALALLDRSHLSCLGDQSYEAESRILQPNTSPQALVPEQQKLHSPEDEGFAVMGTLTQSSASFHQVQSMQSPAPVVQVQSNASPMLCSQGYLQSQHNDSDSHRMQQSATVLHEEAAPLQPTFLSVKYISDGQTAFSYPSTSYAYLDQRPGTKDSSSVSLEKDRVVCTQLEGTQQNVSIGISPCPEVSITKNLDDGLYGSTSQRVHCSDDATSHRTQIAFSEPSCVSPALEAGEPGRRKSEPTRQLLDKGLPAARRRPVGPRHSWCLSRPDGKQQAVIQSKRGRPGTAIKGFNLDIPQFQSSSAKFVQFRKRQQMYATEKEMNENKSSGSFGLEAAMSAYLSQERSLKDQKGGESSCLSAEVVPEDLTAQNKSPYSSGSCSTTQDSVEVDLRVVKTEQFDAESDGMDYVVYENPDTSDTDSCGQSLSHCAQDKTRSCRTRKIITSKLQRHSSHGPMSYYRLRSVLRSKYLLSRYVQNMCIWKTDMSPFRCKVCKRIFKHLSSLKYHCLSTHLSKVRGLKRNLQAKALSPSTPSSQASVMEYDAVRTQHQTESSRTKGQSLTLRPKGKSLARRASQTPGNDGKAQGTRKNNSYKLVLPTITERSGQDGGWMSGEISTQQDHSANIMLTAKKRKLYSPDQLLLAVQAVKNNESTVSEASRIFGVPRKTIDDHVKGRLGKPVGSRPGPSPMLTAEEEASFANYLICMSNQGFPLTRSTSRSLISSLVRNSDRPTLFSEYGPSDKWFRSFLSRHPEIQEQRPKRQNRSKSRMANESVS